MFKKKKKKIHDLNIVLDIDNARDIFNSTPFLRIILEWKELRLRFIYI